MDSNTFKCPRCEHVDSLKSLQRHCDQTHDVSPRQLYLELFLDNKQPSCACGCGQVITHFWDITKGFSKFIRGHHSRVKNNWGHNVQALNKSHASRRESFAAGEWSAWNKGETKHTDDRVASLGKKQSDNFTSERRAKRAEIMTKSWETGAIVPLYGPAHSQWKGGASALQPIVRSRLHAVWTYPKLRASGFRCSACDAPGPGLEVHHDQERFAAILQKAIALFGEVDPSRPDEDFERKDSIADWVTRYHVEKEVSGVVLCVDCHEKAHIANM